MSERDTFGLRLRLEREWRGISLETIASVTRVSPELWAGLEGNDLSRWPSGIFARAFVRDYARAVGLDADEVVGEFCRLFPLADRRAERVLKAHGELIGHTVALDTSMVPPTGDRRASGRQLSEEARTRRVRLAPRGVAAGIDTGTALLVGSAASLVLGTAFWATAGTIGLGYYGVSTVLFGQTPGIRAVEALRQRVPALFTVQDHRAPA